MEVVDAVEPPVERLEDAESVRARWAREAGLAKPAGGAN
jgi:hypothetical protein